MKQILLTAMIGLWATGVIAHSPLEATIPANEAVVAEVPLEVVLDFKGDIRLTRVSMTHADHPSVDLDLESFSGFISDYAIPLQGMGSGAYIIEWRGLGADGHALNGSFSFTVE
jgi:methionine-rich copper-binding protein CopC|tara:strand:+ start:250 stop:591 length:342 start_codon:yes stop_codon:yes gene_type:complete